MGRTMTKQNIIIWVRILCLPKKSESLFIKLIISGYTAALEPVFIAAVRDVSVKYC